MSDKRISELVELTSLAADDELPVVDADANATKRITGANMANFAAQPTFNGNDVYHQGNILGTVSESGGDPTGAVIERGSNANGEYVKYADGTLMCWITSQQTVYFNSFNLLFVWSFPSSFISAPNVTATCNLDTFSSTFTNIRPLVYARSISINSANIGFASNGLFSQGDEALGDDINGFAIGRWF